MAIRDLKDRWITADGRVLAREVVSRLLTGSSLDDLGLGSVAGRTDLRGLWLSDLRGLGDYSPKHPGKLLEAHRAVWEQIDFSYGTLPINPVQCELIDVKFDRVGWKSWNPSSSLFARCTFIGADLMDVNLDGWNGGFHDDPVRHPPSRYVECEFTRTRFGAYGHLGRASFENCMFDSTRFPSPMWVLGAAMRGCTFRGAFRTVCFGWTGSFEGDPPLLDHVDVTAASFDSLEIYACSGSGIIKRPDQVVERPPLI